MRHRYLLPCLLSLFATSALGFSQANGKLQIHFIDVGQGDGAVLISPLGDVALFDNGVRNHCQLPVNYLRSIGVTKIDYHVASHYHDDHIGCSEDVLEAFPLQEAAFDRGGTYSGGTFDAYKNSVGTLRKTVAVGMQFDLDAAAAHPVTIEFVALNGNGVANAKDENDLSVVAVVRFGDFQAEIGGDLSGADTGKYKDIETSVVSAVGQIEVYKVHHHGSAHSTNEHWLSIIKPKIGIISASGEIGRKHGHPTASCLSRLHQAGVKTYWTEEGDGVAPDPAMDEIGGNIVVEVEPGADFFTVRHDRDSDVDVYPMWESTGPVPSPSGIPRFAWSVNSGVYHLAECSVVNRISPNNLKRENTPPADKELHPNCPK